MSDEQPVKEPKISHVRRTLLNRKAAAELNLQKINDALAELDKPGVEEAIEKINGV